MKNKDKEQDYLKSLNSDASRYSGERNREMVDHQKVNR